MNQSQHPPWITLQFALQDHTIARPGVRICIAPRCLIILSPAIKPPTIKREGIRQTQLPIPTVKAMAVEMLSRLSPPTRATIVQNNYNIV